jgi:hypothetical protein
LRAAAEAAGLAEVEDKAGVIIMTQAALVMVPVIPVVPAVPAVKARTRIYAPQYI